MPDIIRFPKDLPPAVRPDTHNQALFKILLLAGITIGSFIFHVWFRTYALTEGFDVSAQRRELTKLESEIVEAKLRKNHLMGPQSLKNLAEVYRRRGIVFETPKARQVFYYRDDE